MSTHPSGQQFKIGQGDYSLVAVEVGGGIRQFGKSEKSIIDGYALEEMCHDARGAVMMPWPNRLANGRYEFGGEQEQLPLTEPSHHNAIHGLVRWANWTPREQTGASVTLGHTLYPQTGYPFAIDLSVTYTLSDTGLEVRMEAVNIGDAACPFGAGQHPYILVGSDRIDDASVRIPGRTVFRYDEQLIPVEKISVAGTALDFLRCRDIGTTEINTNYTDLERDDDGMARISVWSAAGDREATVWMDAAFPHVTVYTGETVQPATRRRRSLAVEPMTCPPNAFASGKDLVILNQGDRWAGHWGITIIQN